MSKMQPCGHRHEGPCGMGTIGLLAKPVPPFAPTPVQVTVTAARLPARQLEAFYFIRPLPNDRMRLTCRKCGEKIIFHRFGTEAELSDETLGAVSHASRCFGSMESKESDVTTTKTEVQDGQARTVAAASEKRGEPEVTELLRSCKFQGGAYRDDASGWAAIKAPRTGNYYVADRVSGRLWGPGTKGGGSYRSYHPRELIQQDRSDVVNWLVDMGWTVNGQGEASPPVKAAAAAPSAPPPPPPPQAALYIPRVSVQRSTTRIVIEEHTCSAQLSGWELRLALGHLGIQPPNDATIEVASDGQGGAKVTWREKVEREERVG